VCRDHAREQLIHYQTLPYPKTMNLHRQISITVLLISVFCATTRAADLATDHIVVVMSVDGLANFYLDDRAAEMPTIRKLAAEGAIAAGMQASNPTVTWPNHTTLVTGVSPARHGVVGNNFFDRAAGKKITVIWDPDFDKEQIVKAPTIYDVAKAAGLTTAAVHWPASRNAKSLDWAVPDCSKPELLAKYSTPVVLDEAKAAGIDLINDADGKPRRRTESTEEDQRFLDVFKLILREHKPNLALFHVLNVDYTEHKAGPRSAEAYNAIKAADDQVRQVWETLQQNFPDKATLFVVSDHGFSLNKTRVAVNPILEKAGLLQVVGDRVTGGDVTSIVQGGSVLLYINDVGNRDAIEQNLRQAFANVEGVDKIIDASEFADYGIGNPQRDQHAPDMVLFAKLGYFFGDSAAGKKTESKGTHGHDSHLPDLRAVFVAAGAGVKPGITLGVINNTDVAPTAAKLLGLKMPDIEGKPLVEALKE
jgi:predicted AlkP superfamily pyrophosphatase or phosphodiesterase